MGALELYPAGRHRHTRPLCAAAEAPQQGQVHLGWARHGCLIHLLGPASSTREDGSTALAWARPQA